MLKSSRNKSDGTYNLRRNHEDTRAATAAPPPQPKCVATTGEIFEDGSILEVVSDTTDYKQLSVAFWDGQKHTISRRLERQGYIYEPATEPRTLQPQTLPKGVAPAESTKKLVGDVSTVIRRYSGLAEGFATLVALFLLSTWVIDAIPTAPWLSILGTETIASAQLLMLLNSLCHHPLILTGVDSTGLFSLSTMWQPTLLIKQQRLNVAMQQLLAATRQRNFRVPRRGRLLDLSCAVATFTEPGWASNNFSGIEIPMGASPPEPAILKASEAREITEDFQGRLLAYRFANYSRVLNSTFDVQNFTIRIRELARSIGRCTPDDPEQQQRVVQLLATQDAEIRSERWNDLTAIVVESILARCHETGRQHLYVGEIAIDTMAFLYSRGETRQVGAREVGERLRLLGLLTQPRDSKGFRLCLSPLVRRRVHELAHSLAGPVMESGAISCPDCQAQNQ